MTIVMVGDQTDQYVPGTSGAESPALQSPPPQTDVRIRAPGRYGSRHTLSTVGGGDDASFGTIQLRDSTRITRC